MEYICKQDKKCVKARTCELVINCTTFDDISEFKRVYIRGFVEECEPKYKDSEMEV